MSNKPWEKQPPPPAKAEPGRIISPVDTITLTLDNRVEPPRVDMKLSRDLPIPLVCAIFASLIGNLQGQLSAQLAATAPILAPAGPPPTLPPAGESSNA